MPTKELLEEDGAPSGVLRYRIWLWQQFEFLRNLAAPLASALTWLISKEMVLGLSVGTIGYSLYRFVGELVAGNLLVSLPMLVLFLAGVAGVRVALIKDEPANA